MDPYSVYNYNTYNNDALIATNPTVTTPNAWTVWLIVAIVLAIIGGVLIYFLFIRSKYNPNSRFGKWLKDFLSFKIMWIEPLLKVVYYILTIFIILASFCLITENILIFLAVLILGPIVLRLIYEATMMFIMIWRNTKDISTDIAEIKNKDKK